MNQTRSFRNISRDAPFEAAPKQLWQTGAVSNPSAMLNTQQRPLRPASAVSSWTGWIGVAGFAIAIIITKSFALIADFSIPLVCVLTGLPMVLFECATRRPWASSSTDWDGASKQARNWGRVLVKLAGFVIAFTMLCGWFYLAPYYQNGTFTWIYKGAWLLGPFALAFAAIYVAWADRYLGHPCDGAWHCGALLLRPKVTTKPDLKLAIEFLLGWFIKGFFFVFLVNILPNNIEFLRVQTFDPWTSVYRFVFVLTTTLFTIDVVIALIGYVCTFKPLGAQIRSPNNRITGWVAALTCYPPFVLIGGFALLDYRKGGVYWDGWISTQNPFQVVWAIAVIACLVIYVWATVAFGIRFSNLTNRGTITHGPYRLFRHPAYVAKNCYWWLIFVPWINTLSTNQAIINCLLLALLTLIYFVRAKTEEAHLLEDPDYQAYVAWFDSHRFWQRIASK